LNEILDYLTNAKIMELAKDTRVLFGAGVLFVLAVIFRWKYVLALLMGLAGTMAVIRYANLGEGEAAIDQNLITFGLGAALVAGVLIYFLFIRSD
jgi:drug/metabolite transporter (DMT)-like permease